MNNKTAFIAAIMALVAVVVLVVSLNPGTVAKTEPGIAQKEAALAPMEPTPAETVQETIQQELVVEETPVLAVPLDGPAVFGTLDYSVTGGKLGIDGSIYDKVTQDAVAVAPLNLYCGGAIIGTGATDGNGAFSLTAYGDCETGMEVWAQVIYKDTAYDSQHSTYVLLETQEHKVKGRSAAAVPTTGVPEFSTLTLGIAVIGACLGLAFLRKE